jgi:glycosyltransferase involved in cell wall biosynthesis
MFNLSDALTKMGHEVECWGMKGKKNIVHDKYNCFAENIDFLQLSSFNKIKSVFSTIYSFKNKKKIKVILDKFKPDIVHIHNFNYQLTPSILPVIKSYGVKIIYTAHDSQLCCPYHRMYNYQTQKICDKCVKDSFFNCLIQKCIDGSRLKSLVGMIESQFYYFLNYYEKYIDIIISPSKFLADRIKKKVNNKIIVIPNFVINNFKEKSLKKEYVLYFGRLSREKGLMKVLPCFEKMKIPLYIIGDGLEKSKINQSEFIKYLGPKYNEELFTYIKNAKFVIQPSNGYENCPMAVLESLMCGTPVIVPFHSGFKELIEDGKNGYYLDFNKENFEKKIKNWFNNYDENLIENCQRIYNEKYTEEIHIQKILSEYKKLINN